MPELIMPIGFEGGISNKSSILLDENEMQTCSGLVYDKMGILKCRPTRTAVNATAVGSIHTLSRYINWLLEGDGSSIRYKWDLNGYCDLYTPADENFTLMGSLESSSRLSVADYVNWMFFVNGRDIKAMTKGNLYEWGVLAPSYAPTAASSGSGTIDGAYTIYYTYYVKFPNGEVVESGPSPSGSFTASTDDTVAWGSIQACPYTGTGIIAWRRLYRTVSGVAYHIATIKDNTTTTYSETYTDAQVQAFSSMDCLYYDVPPAGLTQIEYYLQRVWGIAGNTLYPSEAYLPFNFNPLRTLAVCDEDEELKTLKKWGDQLYMAPERTWFRLQGNDPDTWGIKNTFADAGVINGHTVKVTKYGILGLWYDGLYVFDGSVSRNITADKIGKSLFLDTISDVNACYAEWDGRCYNFYYPTSGTTISQCLTIDFAAYPNLRFYNDDFIATAHHYHVPTGIRYLGKSNGYQYEEAGSAETIATSNRSASKHGGNIFLRKDLQALWYDINTNSKDVIVSFYVDGTLQTHTETINCASRTRKRITSIPHWEGYWFDIALSCADSSSLEIYSPWALIANTAGT